MVVLPLANFTCFAVQRRLVSLGGLQLPVVWASAAVLTSKAAAIASAEMRVVEIRIMVCTLLMETGN
jgi:hypothetical protein